MAINLGNSSGSDEPEVMMDINTTPLIDVMLVLLVMLIITIPIQLHSVTLEMPVGAPPTNQVKPEKIQIDIDATSVVYWQGLPVTAEELDEKMKAKGTHQEAAGRRHPVRQALQGRPRQGRPEGWQDRLRVRGRRPQGPDARRPGDRRAGSRRIGHDPLGSFRS
jgi:biopolymer transport protein ExbD